MRALNATIGPRIRDLYALTAREAEFLHWQDQGLTRSQIAARMGVTTSAIKNIAVTSNEKRRGSLDPR